MNHEPRVLFVAWQCPEPENRVFYPVARLLCPANGGAYEFAYVRGVEDAKRVGFSPFFGEDTSDVLPLEQLPAFLANRLMSPRRPDYEQHVESLGLEHNASPIAILARSEGSKVTDNLEVFAHPMFDAGTKEWIYFGFCRGIRHVSSEEAIAGLRRGDRLVVEPEPTNQFDARALLLLRVDQHRLGYVPHTLVEDFNAALDADLKIDARVERVNPQPSPVQQRLLVRFAVPARDGFRPLSTSRYQPVSQNATQLSAEMLMACS